MKIDDENLKAALDITASALSKSEGELTSAERTAILTVGKALILDIRRIANAVEKLASKNG